ncbi:hypothetical protein [Halomonas llamarensis]|uniref:Lipoprotein n=1 Tax=Halomonas llamarensis TaxID=2945104 RepID=A0ABT0SSE5_9GAMM|nr:hypothetical protein [Halomonas llamarensis]MCL7930671.1 hypothetical protein [Halomonas llamarensis]
MNLKKRCISSIIAIFSPLISGCEAAEIARFYHHPSDAFYENMNFDAPALDEFKDNGVLFVVSVKQATYEDYYVWLGLYATASQSTPIKIIHATLIGNEWQKDYFINKQIIFKERSRDGRLLTDEILVEVGGDFFNLFKKSQNITMEVAYSIDGQEKKKQLVIERRIEKHYIAWPT